MQKRTKLQQNGFNAEAVCEHKDICHLQENNSQLLFTIYKWINSQQSFSDSIIHMSSISVMMYVSEANTFGLNKWLIHSHLSFHKLAWSWTPTRAGKQHYRGKPRWAKPAHKTRIHVTQSAKTETCFYGCNLITQNLLPHVEGNLSQCIAGVHLLINVCIFNTKPAKTLRQKEMECSTAYACVFRRPTLQHPGCLFLNHLPENHPYPFLLHCRHPHHPAKQRSYPPQGVPKKIYIYIFCIFYSYIISSKQVLKKSCKLHTVMPSLDFRASSITFVMAARWGVRQSGLMVDTAEYRPYLKEETWKSEKVSKTWLKLIFANTWGFAYDFRLKKKQSGPIVGSDCESSNLHFLTVGKTI